ncbi:PqqD family peptide modification chaperone [Thermoactinomyces sp. DSM 45892]
MKSNEYYALNETACELIDLMDNGFNKDEACKVLAER